ncbi:hypothetical protein D9758_010173 [Tetrapyrgos nigripes]|uniref:Uncharacterized protein n=1 Tax=Tetrapyrgos nigripes TaxID=182062 RepID=A0A8H5CYP0_9AGAR|nr:hypothetical protein D9758_010173 [Tetrapyrgos nigripes]
MKFDRDLQLEDWQLQCSAFAAICGFDRSMVLIFNDFHAWITIEDKHLEEFGHKGDSKDGITCWVPSEPGKVRDAFPAFIILYFSQTDQPGAEVRKSIGATVVHDKARLEVVKDGYRNNESVKLPFVFEKIETTDPETASRLNSSRGSESSARASSSSESVASPVSIADVGLIYLEIHRVNLVGRQRYDATHTPPESPLYTEEEAKGKIHRVNFGDPIKSQSVTHYHDTEPIGPPVAKFSFRYAPLGVLRANSIAPLSTRHDHDAAVKIELDPNLRSREAFDGSEPPLFLRDIDDSGAIVKPDPDASRNNKRRQLGLEDGREEHHGSSSSSSSNSIRKRQRRTNGAGERDGGVMKLRDPNVIDVTLEDSD